MVLVVSRESWALSLVRVSNLPWATPVASVEAALMGACEALDVDRPSSVVVKGVDRRRARDADKHHGGSALMSFESGAAALECVPAFDGVAVVGASPQRCALARGPAAPRVARQSAAEAEAEAALASRREKRGDARRRSVERRRAARARLATRVSVSEPRVFCPKRLDWESVPPSADPARGGRLRGARARRKRDAVEAFVGEARRPIEQTRRHLLQRHGLYLCRPAVQVVVAVSGQ